MNIWAANFSILANFSQQLTTKMSAESKATLLTNSEVYGQVYLHETPSHKQLHPDNKLLEQANRLEAELLSEESIKENYRGATARKH